MNRVYVLYLPKALSLFLLVWKIFMNEPAWKSVRVFRVGCERGRNKDRGGGDLLKEEKLGSRKS